MDRISIPYELLGLSSNNALPTVGDYRSNITRPQGAAAAAAASYREPCLGYATLTDSGLVYNHRYHCPFRPQPAGAAGAGQPDSATRLEGRLLRQIDAIAGPVGGELDYGCRGSHSRAQRPPSVDTDSSTDSGIGLQSSQLSSSAEYGRVGETTSCSSGDGCCSCSLTGAVIGEGGGVERPTSPRGDEFFRRALDGVRQRHEGEIFPGGRVPNKNNCYRVSNMPVVENAAAAEKKNYTSISSPGNPTNPVPATGLPSPGQIVDTGYGCRGGGVVVQSPAGQLYYNGLGNDSSYRGQLTRNSNHPPHHQHQHQVGLDVSYTCHTSSPRNDGINTANAKFPPQVQVNSASNGYVTRTPQLGHDHHHHRGVSGPSPPGLIGAFRQFPLPGGSGGEGAGGMDPSCDRTAAQCRYGAAQCCVPVHENQKLIIATTREDFLRRRSDSSDSGFHDRRSELTAVAAERCPRLAVNDGRNHYEQQRSPPCLEAHQLSLSAPVTPSHNNNGTGSGSGPPPSKKSSTTPNVIKRQLKTISEAWRPKLGKSKSLQVEEKEAAADSSSLDVSAVTASSLDVSEDENDERRRRNRPNGNDRDRRPGDATARVNQCRSESPRSSAITGSVDSTGITSGARKAKPTTSRSKLWLKWSGGEGKSAPSSPEASRRDTRTQAISEWTDKGGEHITVKTRTNILQLTDGERLALQKIALDRVGSLGLGPITVPKNDHGNRRSIKGIFQLRSHASNVSRSMVDLSAEQVKEKASRSKRWTFGIPLEKCINNDLILGRLVVPESANNGDEAGQLDDRCQGKRGGGEGRGNARLLDALFLSVDPSRRVSKKTRDEGGGGGGDTASPGPDGVQMLRVPYVVKACCGHLREHAIRLTGIFRIAGSKSRINQLRQEFDSGARVELTSDRSLHDVACLLKEFFRDLPDPLLTRDLYNAFLAAVHIKTSEQRLSALRFLVALLPVANRDTLFVLLTFLKEVSKNSADLVPSNGFQLSGNRMDCSNLATVFGPNILHKAKPGKFQLEDPEQMSQHLDVSAIVRDLIDSYEVIFKLPEDIHSDMLNTLMATNPEAADYILCHYSNRSNNHGNNNNNNVIDSHHDEHSNNPRKLLDLFDSRENSLLTNSNSSISSEFVASTPESNSRRIRNAPDAKPARSTTDPKSKSKSSHQMDQIESTPPDLKSHHRQRHLQNGRTVHRESDDRRTNDGGHRSVDSSLSGDCRSAASHRRTDVSTPRSDAVSATDLARRAPPPESSLRSTPVTGRKSNGIANLVQQVPSSYDAGFRHQSKTTTPTNPCGGVATTKVQTNGGLLPSRDVTSAERRPKYDRPSPPFCSEEEVRQTNSSSSSQAGRWEQQRWQYWEELAKQKMDETHEYQTLV